MYSLNDFIRKSHWILRESDGCFSDRRFSDRLRPAWPAAGRPARRDPRRRGARPARAAPHLTRRDNVVTAPDARELARFIRALRQLGALSAGHLA